MPLSTTPAGGPSIPAGAQKVSVKTIDITGTVEKVDVTVLADDERQYADSPLKDGSTKPTGSCTASGLLDGSGPELTSMAITTGWICEEAEISYEVGQYAKWSASWNYYEE